jgi:hypothetical protein
MHRAAEEGYVEAMKLLLDAGANYDDSDIKRTGFFRSIDWESTSQRQASSAFIPRDVCVAEPDRLDAINKYNEIDAVHHKTAPFCSGTGKKPAIF